MMMMMDWALSKTPATSNSAAAAAVPDDNEVGGQVLHRGWLTKSPPLDKATYPIFKAQWKRRWFILQEKEGQYFLHYFDKKKSIKGTINLDECEQVDIGLTVEVGKQRFPHIFDIKTPHRLYYLAADSKEEMTTWVRMVCKACGFKSIQEDDTEEDDAAAGFSSLQDWRSSKPSNTTKPMPAVVAPVSDPPECQRSDTAALNQVQIQTPTNHYIPIASCYSGGVPPVIPSCAVPTTPPERPARTVLPLPPDSLVPPLPPHPPPSPVPPIPPVSPVSPVPPPVPPKKTSNTQEQIYFYMPSVADVTGSKHPIIIPADTHERPSIAYIDLDLPIADHSKEDQTRKVRKPSTQSMGSVASTGSDSRPSPKSSSSSAYQKIDFVKTEAFKRTRHKVEEKYNQN